MVKKMEIAELEKRLKWYEKRYGPYIEKKGFHNWKNLFRKPTMYEWVILSMLILGIFMAWAYNRDTQLCRELIKESNFTFNYPTETMPLNLTTNVTNFTLNEVNTMKKDDNLGE